MVRRAEGEPDLLYIDLHLLHEVTSPQAFDGLRVAGRSVRRPDLTLATEDHNVPTTPGPITDPVSKTQVETLRRNCAEFGVRLFPMGDVDQGIVHVVGPQLGLTQPGMTIVCGDSHTSTHGALQGTGLRDRDQRGRARAGQHSDAAVAPRLRVTVDEDSAGDRQETLDPRSSRRSAPPAGGHGLRDRVSRLRHPGPDDGSRMTVCNMSIEAGAPGPAKPSIPGPAAIQVSITDVCLPRRQKL